MTSLNAAISFLSHLGLSRSDAASLMHQFDNQMSRLMISSHEDFIESNLPLPIRLRLLRAIRCFHRETWSKSLFHHVYDHGNRIDRFEKLIFHLLKYQIWMNYASWTLIYLEKNLRPIDEENLRDFYEKVQHLIASIVRLKKVVQLIRHRLS